MGTQFWSQNLLHSEGHILSWPIPPSHIWPLELHCCKIKFILLSGAFFNSLGSQWPVLTTQSDPKSLGRDHIHGKWPLGTPWIKKKTFRGPDWMRTFIHHRWDVVCNFPMWYCHFAPARTYCLNKWKFSEFFFCSPNPVSLVRVLQKSLKWVTLNFFFLFVTKCQK
jgi:hypothetical protein